MYAWLDEEGWARSWLGESGDRELEIRVDGLSEEDDPEEAAREAVLLDAPWELLARGDAPLALDPLRLFRVARRVARRRDLEPQRLWQPRFRDLRLMFMAAAPQGQVDLDYEREEAEILKETEDNADRLRVVVEETGVLDFLRGRLASDEGPFEALHLTGHGEVDKAKGPVLLLETPEGERADAVAGELIDALGEEEWRPALVVLSACRTAMAGRAGAAADNGAYREPAGDRDRGGVRQDAGLAPGARPELAASFARQLVTQVANVVGWDGSVYDADATGFALEFYAELSRGGSVPRAAALARRALLRKNFADARQGRHWHLARVYLGPLGGGPLCAASKPRRRPGVAAARKVHLDRVRQRVPVASRAEFVGRRRSIQKVLGAFRDGAGVLVHGMGALGKSSLAERVINRQSRRPVIVFESYDALSVFDALLSMLPDDIQDDEKSKWRGKVAADDARLALALKNWLEGPLDEQPVLLVIDDLERVLQTPRPVDAYAAVAVKDKYGAALGAVLSAFGLAESASRLLLTSRYDFRLPDGRGADLAAQLVRVPLAPMTERERIKQLRASERMMGREGFEDDAASAVLLERAVAAAAGNPGLQAILTDAILNGEFAQAEQALEQLEEFRKTGLASAAIQALIDTGKA
jgi:hypothetical protein